MSGVQIEKLANSKGGNRMSTFYHWKTTEPRDLYAEEQEMAEWEEHPGKSPLPNPLPPWIFREVTEEPREYSNQALAWKYGRKVIL